MNKLLTELADYLEDQSIGTVGTDIFQYVLPDSPVACIAIVPTGGTFPNEALSLPTYQILIRSTTKALAESKAKDIYLALNQQWNVLATVRGWHSANHQPGPMWLDDANRPIFTLNFQFHGIGSNVGL